MTPSRVYDPHRAPRTAHRAPRTAHRAPRTAHRAPRTRTRTAHPRLIPHPMPVRALHGLTLAWFDATGLDIAPPDWLQHEVLAFVPDMPADLAPDRLAHPAYQWLRLASAFDFAEHAHGARHLTCLTEPTRANCWRSSLNAAGDSRANAENSTRPATGFLRGLAYADDARHRAALGACVQGLANLAQARGDSDTAERLAQLILVHGAIVPRYAHVAALLTLAVLHRQQQRFASATRYAWQAYGLVEGYDERRAMALVELAHLALARVKLGAAERGFAVVLSFARSVRVRRPARSGALATALAHWRTNEGHASARAAVQQPIAVPEADEVRALERLATLLLVTPAARFHAVA